MGDQKKMAQFVISHANDYSVKGNRPIYICTRCRKKKERGLGEFETAQCACGGIMNVSFSKDP